MDKSESGLQRRVAGYHDIRLDGILDIVPRAHGSSIMDIGCNRGLVAFEMANNGARVVHGCDNYADGIRTARELFADLRNVRSQFEVVDLREGPSALDPFGKGHWDIVLMLATYHKLKRVMSADALAELIYYFGKRTEQYFCWRGTSDKGDENEQEIAALDRDLGEAGLKRIHTSYISKQLSAAAIWGRA